MADNNQFEFFKSSVQHWLKFFGLTTWRVDVVEKELEDSYAVTHWDTSSRGAVITVNSKPDELFNPGRTAFHEVCELMLAPLSTPLFDEYGRSWTEGEVHRIIRTLENTVYEAHKSQDGLIARLMEVASR